MCRETAPLAIRPILTIAIGASAVLMALSGRYGFHRDELYFLTAGDHLSWGYVDQPPLTPLLANASTAVFGETPTGLRIFAIAAFAAIVFTVAAIAAQLGAGRGAQILAASIAAVGSFVPALGHMVSTTTFDILAWLGLVWVALRLLRTRDGRWWLAIGTVVGIGLLNKYLIVLLVASLLAGLLITGPRSVLRSWWLPAGIAVALAIASPNLVWQAAHDWPQLTVAGGISADDGTENRIMFVPEQLLYVSPLLVPVWVAGWWRLWGTRRLLAVAYPLLCIAVFIMGGKGYYTLPLLLVLTAAGCQPTLEWSHRSWRRGLVIAGVVTTAITSAVTALPVLPPDQLAVVNAVNKEQGEQVGWPELVDTVAKAWDDLPSTKGAVVFTENYGQAGAIAHYGPQHELPQPYSGHMSYADWGPPPDSATGPLLLVGDAYAHHFNDCRVVGRVDNGNVDNEEQGTEVLSCASPGRPWSQLWPSLRHFY